MSLILDALRKSEHQRQRQVGPGLAVVPEARPTRRPPGWVLILVALLALNIIVLAALLLTDRRAERVAADPPAVARSAAPALAPARATPSPTPAAATGLSTPVELPARPRREDVRPLTTEVAPPSVAPAPAAAQATTGAGPEPAPPGAANGPAPQTASRASSDAGLPRFADLVIRGELNVPHMHLDIHVHSGNPAERFVFINMRKYLEGQATQEGPRVERITPEGVVMDYQGQRFLLARD
jgi:general secretion pathway protein B